MIFVNLLLFSFFLHAQSLCTPDSSSFLTNTAAINLTSASSPTNEIIDGVDYGKLYATTKGMWMSHPFNVSKSTSLLTSSCPKGWVPPTLNDLQDLLNFVNYNASLLTDPSTLNMNPNMTYASNTKLYPNLTDGSDNNAWLFYGIKLNSNIANLSNFSSYWNYQTSKILCVLSAKSINNTLKSESGLNILGLSSIDLIKGIRYTLSVNNTNLIAYQWNISNQTNNSQSLQFIPMKYGSFKVNVKAVLFDYTTIGFCETFWVRNYTGSEADTTLNSSDLHEIIFADQKAYRATSLHFTAGAAPIAPIDTGGAYIFYANTSNNSLFVKIIDNDGNQSKEIDLGRNGYPCDIVSVPCGFVSLIKDYNAPNKLYLYGMNVCTSEKTFERIIMNNGVDPNVSNSDQINFYSDGNGTPAFGMLAMYNPHNGRLTLARDRIVSIFAHYNHFGFNTDGSRNDHTGDTFVTFNMTGKDEKMAFSWGASHSLRQTLVYNGNKALAASLGDAYPLNIRFVQAETSLNNSNADPYTGLYNRLDNIVNSTLLSGDIPGDGGGKSCGRIGTISVFGDTAYMISYARRSCSATLSGVTKTSSIDKMGLAFYDDQLNRTNDVNLGPGANINQIQSAKYGNNIFVAYVTSNRTSSVFLADTISNTDSMNYSLLSLNGTVISGPFFLNQSILPPTDDMRVLNDGRVAWTFIDSNKTLHYYYLTKPNQTETNENLVVYSGYYNNASNFYFINSSDSNVYKASSLGILINNTANNNNNNNGSDSSGLKLLANYVIWMIVLLSIWLN